MKDLLTKNLAYLLRGKDKAAQADIAFRTKVAQPTISKWGRLDETDSGSEPEFRSMARLALALDVSLDDLAYRDLEAEGCSPAKTVTQAIDEPAFYEAFRSVRLITAKIHPHSNGGNEAEAVLGAYLGIVSGADPYTVSAAIMEALQKRGDEGNGRKDKVPD